MIGRNVGNYQIVRALGEGGMGTVYLAAHPKIGKKVAIKMLHAHLCSDADLVSRFFQEARAVNEIGHPNIVDISDFGEVEGGGVYFIMELLNGRTLREHLKEAGGGFPVERALGIARQVADALGAAHKVGIVHRDLKPENIFMVEGASGDAPGATGDKVKLFDFGLAKLTHPTQEAAHKTAAGSVLGSPFYMAPEQILSTQIDARTDVYAMGGVLYEMLTGQVPFRATQLVDLLAAVVREIPAPPDRIKPGIPATLSALVLRCLEKDPAARPQTMGDLAAGLKVIPDPNLAMGATMMVPAATPASGSGHGGIGANTPPPALPPLVAQVLPLPGARSMAAAPPALAPLVPGRPAGASGAAHASAASASGGAAALGGPSSVHPRMSATMMRSGGGVARRAQEPERFPRLTTLIETFNSWHPLYRMLGVGGAIALVVIIAIAALSGGDEDRPAVAARATPTESDMAVILLESNPSGARVVRVNDGTILGATPTRDYRPADGRRVEYLFRRPGFVDAHVPFLSSAPGEHPLSVTLIEDEAPRRAQAYPQATASPATMAAADREPARRSYTPARRSKPRASRTARVPPPAPKSAAIAAPAPDPKPKPRPAAPPPPTHTITRGGAHGGAHEQYPPLLPSVRVKRLGRN